MNYRMSGARIIRGFSRIAIGTAVLIAICGIGATAVVVGNSRSLRNALPAVEQKASKTSGANIYAQVDSPLPPGFVIDPSPSPAVEAAKTAGIGLGITALLALGAFGFFRGLGWILAAFARH